MPQSTEQRTHILESLDEISRELPHAVSTRERAAYLLKHFFRKEIDQLMKVIPEEKLSYLDRRFLWAKAVEIEEAFLFTGPHAFSAAILQAISSPDVN